MYDGKNLRAGRRLFTMDGGEKLQEFGVFEVVGDALHEAADIAAIDHTVIEGSGDIRLLHGDEALHFIAPDRSFLHSTDTENETLAGQGHGRAEGESEAAEIRHRGNAAALVGVCGCGPGGQFY